MSTQDRAVARTEAVAIAERVGVEAGVVAVALTALLDGVSITDQLAVSVHRIHDPAMRAIVLRARDLAQQVSALAGAVEQLATAV